MLSFGWPVTDGPLRVLCLGAHCDDIEIGCGATLLKLADSGTEVHVSFVVFAANDIREAELRKSLSLFAGDRLDYDLVVYRHRNGYFPHVGAEIKDRFEELKSNCQPDLIFSHYGKDHHQDHRLISELTWNTFRDHLILEYEIPKYDGGMGSPSVFVFVDEEHVRRKSEILSECYVSQQHRQWFSKSTFTSLMRIRGVECNSRSGYAEAFYLRKAVIGD
jgi:LmbE family N-acetylglucosaminyl deacetylase